MRASHPIIMPESSVKKLNKTVTNEYFSEI